MLNCEERTFLKSQLDYIYSEMKNLPNTKIRGTTEYKILYALEAINMELEIPFED